MRVLHDRDTKFCASFRTVLAAGEQMVHVPSGVSTAIHRPAPLRNALGAQTSAYQQLTIAGTSRRAQSTANCCLPPAAPAGAAHAPASGDAAAPSPRSAGCAPA